MKKFHISAFSKGLYSNWFWHHPSRTLFDIGEGFATYAGNFIFGVERICISHAVHGDHIGGLATFIGIRNSSRGDKEKPLDIYYPADDTAIDDYKEFINRRFGKWLTFKINWFPIKPYELIKVFDSNHAIESFKLHHTKNSTTLGYRIVEWRSRLKPEYRGQDIPALIKSGLDKSKLNEDYKAITLAYCLDAYSLNPVDIADAELAIMDCSFVNKNDREDLTHFTLEEALAVSAEANVKTVAMAHFSSRYNKKQILDAIPRISQRELIAILPNEVHEI